MVKKLALCAALLAACATDNDPTPEDQLATTTADLGGLDVSRVQLAGDVYEYTFRLRVGDGPNAVIAIHRVVRERAPWIPRKTTAAVMALHGDFAKFDTNFPGMARWLAERGIDVWGADRRWASAPVDADFSDFDAMSLDQELDDLGAALAFARGVRLVTSGSADKLTLIGFSRGGELAYFYASREATRPPALRHVKGLVPLDVYVSLAPEDEDQRQFFCQLAADEYAALADGFVDVPNDFQILTGQLALDDPDGDSPFADERTNQQWLWIFSGKTYLFFPATPLYHLAGVTLTNNVPTGLRFSPEDALAHWFADAPPHQSMRESADTDALTCGDAPLPLDLPLSRIHVPLFLIAAAGGYGEHAIHSTTQVGSTDVTTLIVRQLPVEQEREDFGHGDLLYGTDAPALAWQPLLTWLGSH